MIHARKVCNLVRLRRIRCQSQFLNNFRCQSKQKNSQKTVFRTVKSVKEGAKNLYGGYPTEFAGSTQNPKKIIGTSNQPKKFSKNCVSYRKKCKGAKNSYGGYPAEFAGSTQNPKKIIRTSNQPIKTQMFPKKVCLVP
jgi:hypothetical protein